MHVADRFVFSAGVHNMFTENAKKIHAALMPIAAVSGVNAGTGVAVGWSLNATRCVLVETSCGLA